jgi:hypothetical protein
MYLLGGAKAPDHNTIARFRTKRLNADVMDGLFGQFTMLSAGIGELSCKNIFIDGTKSEAFPNRYKFVWKKSVEMQSAEMQKKMKKELPGLAADAGVEFEPAGDTISKDALSRLIATLRREKKRLGVEFVSGTGKRKTAPQKLTEAAEGYLARMRRYENDQTFKLRNVQNEEVPYRHRFAREYALRQRCGHLHMPCRISA